TCHECTLFIPSRSTLERHGQRRTVPETVRPNPPGVATHSARMGCRRTSRRSDRIRHGTPRAVSLARIRRERPMTRTASRWVAPMAAFLVVACAAAPLGTAPGSAGVAWADGEKQKKSVDVADGYVGDAKKWDKPAEGDPAKVYA